jgi:hypothetical protein
MANAMQFDAVFDDGALYKHGNLGQGIYIDPERDFVGVYFSTNGYAPPMVRTRCQGFRAGLPSTLMAMTGAS